MVFWFINITVEFNDSLLKKMWLQAIIEMIEQGSELVFYILASLGGADWHHYVELKCIM